MSFLHEAEDLLQDLLSSLNKDAPEVRADFLAAIIGEQTHRGHKLLLVPRLSASFPREYKDEYPRKPVDALEDLDAAELLRSFFSRGEAWKRASDRCVQAAALAVARQAYPKTGEIRFAVRLGEVVQLAILGRHGIRSVQRYGLPPFRSDDREAYLVENTTEHPASPSLAPPTVSMAHAEIDSIISIS